MPVDKVNENDLPRLFDVWEQSVRATHDFLSEEGIRDLVPLVRQILQKFAPLYCLRDTANQPFAFIGVADGNIEMLFVHPEHRGGGAGRTLIHFAVSHLNATKVDVNEQNHQAVGFYARMGFRMVGRSEKDPFGQPYPLLHLALPGK
ncbi:acetyltransferase [Pseudoduganella albidiflava]|uniref:Acetyltransferase n=1 Tax=Pseudoduganella albidiflava TaxID=321983 RepID=A0A411X0A0_9BURK|nr:acetyltransferase [Pseudoduganella albidiflava]QBI02380.1 acetyltransferase [Pseudoduganella albidiflava]GGY43290.1 acetyltransferase [Pseudoduganella albidiflava]